MYQARLLSTVRIEFPSGSALSHVIDLKDGAFGTFIIPTGSPVVGKTIQFVAVESEDMPPAGKILPDTDLLSSPKSIAAAGASALTSTEVNQVGAAGKVRFKLDSAVGSAATIFLLWKS